MQRAVNTTIEEEVFSMWFAYINCWAMDAFSMGPHRDYINSSVVQRERGIRTLCGGGVEYSTVTLRDIGGDEKGSLKSETVKYGHQSRGT
jgi:hypothetical protein